VGIESDPLPDVATALVDLQGFLILQNRTQTRKGQLPRSLKDGWYHWFCQDGSDAQPQYGIV